MKPMTIEQINAIWAQLYPGAPLTQLALNLVRAVEAHHGIGGAT